MGESFQRYRSLPVRTNGKEEGQLRLAFFLRGDVPIQEAPFSPFEFVPTKVSIAEEEVDFGNTLLRFIEAEWRHTLFTKSFYVCCCDHAFGKPERVS